MATSPLKAYYQTHARAVAAHRRGRGLPRLARPKRPVQAERAYFRDLKPWVDFAHDLVSKVIVPSLPALMNRYEARKDAAGALHKDDAATEIAQLIEQVRVYYQRRYTKTEAEALAQKYALRAQAFTAEQIQEQFRRVLGVDALTSSPAIADAVKLATAENVGLITSIPEQYLGQVERTVFDFVRSGASSDDLVSELENRYNVATSRAVMIARDQTSKMNGALTEVTQRGLGITGYIWRTAGDARVRDSHAALEGRSFDWSDPPSVGPPGADYNCRCDAEPDFAGLLDDEG